MNDHNIRFDLFRYGTQVGKVAYDAGGWFYTMFAIGIRVYHKGPNALQDCLLQAYKEMRGT